MSKTGVSVQKNLFEFESDVNFRWFLCSRKQTSNVGINNLKYILHKNIFISCSHKSNK